MLPDLYIDNKLVYIFSQLAVWLCFYLFKPSKKYFYGFLIGMEIKNISFQHNNSLNKRCSNPTFKATYPVVHWVSETNGSAARETNLDVVRTLQGKLVRLINKVSKSQKNAKIQPQLPLSPAEEMLVPPEVKVHNLLKKLDMDFRRCQKVRSFYDRSLHNQDTNRPRAYAITGIDIQTFENTLAKKIGIEKSEARQTLGTPYSEKAKAAIDKYCKNGLNFVLSPQRRIYDNSGKPCVLHTHFQVIRNSIGEIKGYKLLDAKFLPQRF